MASTSFEWFSQAELGKYKGRYVIIRGKRILYSGRNPERLLRRFRRKHVKETPLLAKIPSDETLILVGSCG